MINLCGPLITMNTFFPTCINISCGSRWSYSGRWIDATHRLRPPELGVVCPPEVDVLCPPEIGILDPLELGVMCLVVPSSLGMWPVAALVFCLAVVSLGML